MSMCVKLQVSVKIPRMIKQYNITNRIVIVSLYVKTRKFVGSSVLNLESNTNWQGGGEGKSHF
jgi:hypothetical protein